MKRGMLTLLVRSVLLLLLAAAGVASCYEEVPFILRYDMTPPSEEVEYELLSMSYGTSEARRDAPFFLGRPGKKKLTARWQFWLLRGGGRVIVIDPGFTDRGISEITKIENTKSHQALLAEVGLRPSNITAVILSRINRFKDNACDLFPKADFYVQSVDYARAQMKVAKGKAEASNVDPNTLAFLKRMDKQGRLVLMDGAFEIFDGLQVNVTDAYKTHALSFFTVRTHKGKFVIPGDLVPSAGFLNTKLRSAKKKGDHDNLHRIFVRLAGERKRVLPSFDPGVATRFEKLSDNVVRIAAPPAPEVRYSSR